MKFLKGLLFILLLGSFSSQACSILYYIDPQTGDIYAINNEDYYFDVNAYYTIEPSTSKKHARFMYGWDDFMQGGINEHGLFFDAAVTPKDEIPKGFSNPNGRDIGAEILAYCTTVKEAVSYMKEAKVAVSTGHLLFGDATGNALIIEWIDGEQVITKMKDNYLIATNYLLNKPEAGNFPCYRYQSIEERVKALNQSSEKITLNAIGQTMGGAAQLPQKDEQGREGGTLYTSFFNISEMKMVLVYKLDNNAFFTLDLKEEFSKGKKQKFKLKKLLK